MRRVSNQVSRREEKDQKSQKPLIDGHNFASCESLCSKSPNASLKRIPQPPDLFEQIERL
jgi:hypothetical protein